MPGTFNRQETFARRSAEILSALSELRLIEHVTLVAPLTPTGRRWQGTCGSPITQKEFTDKSLGNLFLTETGGIYPETTFISDVVTEIQLMLPSVEIVLAPGLKKPFNTTLSGPYNMSRQIRFDEVRKGYFIQRPYGYSSRTGRIYLALEQFAEDFLRSAYRSVWDILTDALHLPWLIDAEKERILAVTPSEFNPTPTDTSISEYLGEIREGKVTDQVDRMLSWAGTGFECYLTNLRLLHTVPYIMEDADTGDLIMPRYARLYHAILDGEGDLWLQKYRLRKGFASA